MSTPQIVGWAIAAVLVFWAVGAYNRLVSLRNDISRAFVPVDAQIRQRHMLLEQWVDALRPLLEHNPQSLDAVLAACGQLQAACDVVRARPSAARPMASLRLAEETLAEARTRLKGDLPARPEMLAGLGVAVFGEELSRTTTMRSTSSPPGSLPGCSGSAARAPCERTAPRAHHGRVRRDAGA